MVPPDLPRLTIAGARRHFAGLVNRVAYRGERIVLTRHGRPVAALVPLHDVSSGARPVPRPGPTASVSQAIARRLEAELGL